MNLIQLKNQWLPVCSVLKISRHPQRFVLLNIPIVIFRLNDKIIALQDRCPHRGVPLSQGKVKGEVLQCAYHGWSFNASGQCVDIPGLTKDINCSNKSVPAYLTKIHLGLIFICLEKNADTIPVYTLSMLETDQYHTHLLQHTFKGEVLNLLENFLDATHTNFVHAGLLRHDNKRQIVKATLKVNEVSAEVLYENEPSQSGIVSKIFERNRKFSIGRFHLPLIAELEYHGHQYLTAAFTLFLSPITLTNEYNIFLLITLRKNWLSHIKKIFLLPFIKLALKQDKNILNKQNANLDYFSNTTFKSTELDILRQPIQNILNSNSSCYQKKIKMNL